MSEQRAPLPGIFRQALVAMGPEYKIVDPFVRIMEHKVDKMGRLSLLVETNLSRADLYVNINGMDIAHWGDEIQLGGPAEHEIYVAGWSESSGWINSEPIRVKATARPTVRIHRRSA